MVGLYKILAIFFEADLNRGPRRLLYYSYQWRWTACPEPAAAITTNERMTKTTTHRSVINRTTTVKGRRLCFFKKNFFVSNLPAAHDGHQHTETAGLRQRFRHDLRRSVSVQVRRRFDPEWRFVLLFHAVAPVSGTWYRGRTTSARCRLPTKWSLSRVQTRASARKLPGCWPSKTPPSWWRAETWINAKRWKTHTFPRERQNKGEPSHPDLSRVKGGPCLQSLLSLGPATSRCKSHKIDFLF